MSKTPLVILFICTLLVGCIGVGNELEHYAKRVPLDTMLIYADYDKIGILETYRIPSLIPSNIEDLMRSYREAKDLGVKRVAIVIPDGYQRRPVLAYGVLIGDFDVKEVESKLIKGNYNLRKYEYNGFIVYETPYGGFIALSREYIVIQPYPYYSSEYILDLLSGRMVESSLYNQYEGIISKLPSGAAIYALTVPPQEVYMKGVERVGVAVFLEGENVRYVYVLEYFSEEIAEKDIDKIKESISDYKNSKVSRDGKYVIVEYTEQRS